MRAQLMVGIRHLTLFLGLFLVPLGARADLHYRTAELKRLTEVLRERWTVDGERWTEDSLHEGRNTVLVGDRPVRVDVEAGTVSSMGYVLFPDEMKRVARTPILGFLERYFLQLDYPHADRPQSRMLREDRVRFEVGSPATVATLGTDCGFSYGYERKRYVATWSRDGQTVLAVSFPANHELISGENKIETERFVETDIRASQPTAAQPVKEELLTPTVQKNYYVKRGGTYLNDLLTSDLYYQRKDSLLELIVNETHPLESAANLMLCPDQPEGFNLKVKQLMYGYKKKFYDVPLRNWITYCLNSGCELYFGVESFDKGLIKASVIAVNSAENYNHVLFVNIPLQVMAGGTGDVEAQLETFIPMHNVVNMFAKYKKRNNKQPKTYEQ